MAYYDRYRGSRRRRQNRLKTVLLILGLLVILGLAVLFFLQETIIYTQDGFHFSFSDRKEPELPGDSDDGGDVHLNVQDPQPATDSTPDLPAATEPPAPQHTAPEHTAALVADGHRLLEDKAGLLQDFSGGSYRQLALAVRYADGISLVDDDDVSDGVDPQAAPFALELDSLEMGRIALFSALRDNVRPRTNHRASALHTQSGATWLDRDYTAWFDPQGKDTASCLLATIRACEAVGFDLAVLRDFQYPTEGKPELIDLPADLDRVAALTGLAKKVRAGTDIALGLILSDEAAALLTDPVTGQDVALLGEYFDVLYVPAADFSHDLSPLEEALTGTDCRVGLYLQTPAPIPADFEGDYLMGR